MVVTATPVHVEVDREDREDLVAVDRLSLLVDREHPVSVAVEGDAEIEAAAANGVRQAARGRSRRSRR